MTVVFNELVERLKRLDEITLLELLELDSEQLVERFSDIIEDNYEKLLNATED
jgi:hypothetical protein